jgi:hypothetical protein
VAAELLAEETLTLADVHQIATRLGVARHAYVPSPHLPGQVRAAKPVVCMEVPSTLDEAPADPEGVGWRSRTGAARRRSPALVRALIPWRRRRQEEPATAEG